jgi:hypothetical protein
VNAILAHKNELERLLIDLSGDIAVSEMNFAALVDAYITRLDTNCSDISARVSPPPAQINGELAALFRKFRAAAREQGPDVRRHRTSGDLLPT